MKKTLLLLIGIAICTSLQAQKKDKVKGNRQVTLQETLVDEFNKIIIEDDFKILLSESNKSSVQIEADDNLHEVIKFEVIDSTLRFFKHKRITSKKRLNITLNYTNTLRNIEVRENGELSAINTFKNDSLLLLTENNAKSELNIEVNNFEYHAGDKSKTKLNLKADTTSIELHNNSKLELYLTGESANFNILNRANISVLGKIENGVIIMEDTAKFKGNEFECAHLKTTLNDSSTLNCYAGQTISINATDDSDLYLYGSPKITIDTFEDNAKLQKKQ